MTENTEFPKLVQIGGEVGNYCDPVTGECHSVDEKENPMTTAIDPVCKMEVEIETAQLKSDMKAKHITSFPLAA